MRSRCLQCSVVASFLALIAPTALYAQTPLGTGFTYQGQLKEAGAPGEGTYDFMFQLCDAAEGGAVVSGDLYVDDWPVEAGLFTVPLDFGDGMFTGEERWLQVHVRPGDSSEAYTELSPRQPLTGVPYALYALNGPESEAHWTANGDDIYNTNIGNVGVGTSTPDYPLHVSNTASRSIFAENTATSGQNYAVYATTDSTSGRGVYGFAGADTGTTYALYGRTASTSGRGVYGIAAATSGTNYGVYGESESPDGRGVYGVAQAETGENYGVYGRADGTAGRGVYGEHTDSGNYGILGRDEYGVEGRGDTAGGYFEDASGSGYAYVGSGMVGVLSYGELAGGWFEDANGSGYAIVGVAETGVGGYGHDAGGYFADTNSSGYAWVGYGDRGVEALGSEAGGYFGDTDGSGYAYVARGDRGIDAKGNEAGGYFEDLTGSGYAYVASGDAGIEAYGIAVGGYFEDTNSSGWGTVGNGSYKIQGNGAVSFVQNHPDDPDDVIVYACPEGNEVATYTRGTARLVDGIARVPLGETFKWVTNPDIGLTAHLTPRGQAALLYVESLTTTEMVVRSGEGFPDDVVFDYLAYGLRIGFEEVSIIQEKEREACIPSMVSHRALYERRPELRDYNALERFKQMRAETAQTEPLDLSASQALHDAIVEFDPEIHGVEGPHTPRPEEHTLDAERGPASSTNSVSRAD